MSTGGERFEKWAAERKARRADPGNCSSCGNPNPGATKRGTCDACKARNRDFRARKRALRIETEQGVTVMVDRKHLAEVFQRMARMEARIKVMQNYNRAHYRRGYAIGLRRGRIEQLPTPDPVDWDAWKDRLDYSDKVRMNHRMGSAGE
jgi:hypothetical protein